MRRPTPDVRYCGQASSKGFTLVSYSSRRLGHSRSVLISLKSKTARLGELVFCSKWKQEYTASSIPSQKSRPLYACTVQWLPTRESLECRVGVVPRIRGCALAPKDASLMELLNRGGMKHLGFIEY